MTIIELLELYNKERDYERCIFGEYKNVPSLSLPSFLLFIEAYLKKAKDAYSGKWQTELPEWLKTCREHEQVGSAPIRTYEELIKIMALAGAALETYANIDPEKWREDLETHISKWKD